MRALEFKDLREKIVDWALEAELFYTSAITYKIRLSKEIAFRLGNYDLNETFDKNMMQYNDEITQRLLTAT